MREGRITSRQAELWDEIRQMSDDEFERTLRDWYPGGRQREPAHWNDPAYHDASQPVVGVFPGGDTPEGVSDLTGNVWEWTSSAYEAYPYRADRRREDPERTDARRVVRGAFRYVDVPGYRNHYLGLRLVCFSPILDR
ncbi:SUMF1/EgtB/PvdO family nonheme iron enzyme [Accumulibacter sp.]|uniref:formylglycine-generating enzyme family protein n=1 Tax=Accumulibacter sp. TaxID=2053492 RepID=UPI0025D9C4EC|nr:SUMF1/EgtB/PvdO family nonheme iron enzyme [Accumulibacter sp.]MCM8595760.1 SUMF1/EgtB/PvdO family nonheme iron enzyme [Accumulibacter sp.]MCM8626609.1 SUMF1/EgtB/PvdO family nonheme iron enzyme [Accumulibacter sp.]MDS4049908.1 SUMF1/EgtB/PvdO family nonheme iron enzyme [Accumulibacter sp.]